MNITRTHIVSSLVLAAGLSLAGASHAAVLVSYQPTTPDGQATDAWNSGGAYLSSQTIAAQFTLAQDSALESFTVWGASANLGAADLSNVAGVQVVIWNDNFSAPVLNLTYTVDQLMAVATGQTTQNGGVQYEISAALGGVLAKGSYHFNVGAILVDGGADPFQWSTSSGGSLWSNAFDGAGWTESSVDPTPAFVLNGTPVPAPGALALLAVLGWTGSRRRATVA